ncbi:MAG: lytic transglycosylase domain-containing protein [Acidobacteria bacterium]|nr:lytic transglycosylase domain-containing protein [Acidobacteriota bacterium]
MVEPEEDPAAAGPQPAAAVAPAVSPYDGFITGQAAAYGVDPDLVRAVIAVESGFNPLAVSRRGAVGLMQLIPSTARRFGVRNIFHPEQNIEGGIRYLRFLLDTFNNDLKLTLAAYNAGENIVRRLGGIPNYPETLAYIRRVTGRYGESYRLYRSPPAPLALTLPPAAGAIHRIVDSRGNIIYTNLPSLP